MRVLVASSGGVDSTYLLWKLATTTADEITAVYFDSGISLSIYGELPALRNALDWIRANVRDIPLVTKSVIYSDWRYPMVYENCGAMMDGFDECYTGRGIDNGKIGGAPNFSNSEKISYYRSLFAKGAPDKVMRSPLSEWGKARSHCISEMPADLFALTLGCYKPKIQSGVFQHKCGRCPKCLMDQYCVDALAQGKSPDDINDELLRLRGSGKYAADGPLDERYVVPAYPVPSQ